MLDTDTVFTQWENGNSLRKFPFAETSSLVSTDGKELPDNIITDLLLFFPHSEHQPELSCVKLSPGAVFVAIVLDGNLIASCIVPRKGFEPYVPYPMDGVPGTSGYITFGNILWPDEEILYKFTDAVVDVKACVSVHQPGVTAFVDDVSGEELSGVVSIEIPAFMTASVTHSDDGSHHVSFDLTNDGNLMLATPCHAGTDEEVCGVPIIRSICGVKPDNDGMILLRLV